MMSRSNDAKVYYQVYSVNDLQTLTSLKNLGGSMIEAVFLLRKIFGWSIG